ncbi:MAG TPA: FecR domain-containing protein [Paucimonas sp.]|nr:FecR domain-containing protein [Paucimonas sp.]
MRKPLCRLLLLLVLAAGSAHAGPAAAEGKPGSITVAAAGIIYHAQAGDTLMSVAQQFTGKAANWAALGKLNDIRKDDSIPIGTGIVIPADLLLDEPTEAKVAALSGTIVTKGADGGRIALAVGARIIEGMEIETSANGFLTITLPDSSRVSIPSNSRVKLAKLRVTRYTKSPRTEVTLLRGRVESRVAPLEAIKGRFEVHTPRSVAGVRGTHFRVGWNGKTAANEVLDGSVAVGKDRQTETVRLAAARGSVAGAAGVGPAVDLLPAPQVAAPAGTDYPAPAFTLVPVSGAAAYHVQVSTDRDAQNVIAESRSPQTTLKVDGIRDGDYFMHVSAIDQAGLEGLVRTQAFRLQIRPESRARPAASGAPLVERSDSKTVTLRWPAQAGKQYRLQVSRDPDFSWLIHTKQVTAPEATLPRPDFGTYYARVQTVNADGSVNAFSPVQPFVVTDHWVINDGSQAKVTGSPSGANR